AMDDAEIEQYVLFYGKCLEIYEENKKLNTLCMHLMEFQKLNDIKHTNKFICPNLEGEKHFYELNHLNKYIPSDVEMIRLNSEKLIKQMNVYDKICGVYLWIVEIFLINLGFLLEILLNVFIFHRSTSYAVLNIITGIILIILLSVPITYVKSGWFTRIRFENKKYQILIKKLPYIIHFKQETHLILNNTTQFIYSPTITHRINEDINRLQKEIIILKKSLSM